MLESHGNEGGKKARPNLLQQGSGLVGSTKELGRPLTLDVFDLAIVEEADGTAAMNQEKAVMLS